MSYKYMIRLKPTGYYYFGGETTLGEGDSQNYYAKSNRLPQVSALLGIVRYELLRQNGLLNDGKQQDSATHERIAGLIGVQGFSIDNPSETYGIIQRISPLFVEGPRDVFYTMMPLDYGMDIELSKDVCSFSSAATVPLATIRGYDAKNYDNYLYWINGKGEKLEMKQIFTEREQIGITKKGRDNSDEDAFFKLAMYGLLDPYCFAFTLETSDPIATQVNIPCVLGGNRSTFMMCINEINDFDFCSYFHNLHKDGRHLLLGDAYLTDEQRDSLPFIWGTSQCNRYIVTKHNEAHHWRKPCKTNLYRLLGRGGVIICPEDHLKDLCPTTLCNVGLNIFI